MKEVECVDRVMNYKGDGMIFTFRRSNRHSLFVKEFKTPEEAIDFILKTRLQLYCANGKFKVRKAFIDKMQSLLGGRKELFDYFILGKFSENVNHLSKYHR